MTGQESGPINNCHTSMILIMSSFSFPGINFLFFLATVIPLAGMTPTYYCLIIVFWDIMLGRIYFISVMSSVLFQKKIIIIINSLLFVLG